jgi:hypothetical protein
MRFEWVEIIVRIAITKYYDAGIVTDLSEAVNLLCQDNIQPHLEEAARHIRNDFRRKRLYNEPTDTLLKNYNRILHYMFKKYCKGKAATKDTVMDIKEWTGFLMDMNVIDPDFTKREGRLCFTMSKMLVADEVKRDIAWTTMTYFDFLEALCRVSELKSFPLDKEIRIFGHKNVVDFFRHRKTMTEWEGGEKIAHTSY